MESLIVIWSVSKTIHFINSYRGFNAICLCQITLLPCQQLINSHDFSLICNKYSNLLFLRICGIVLKYYYACIHIKHFFEIFFKYCIRIPTQSCSIDSRRESRLNGRMVIIIITKHSIQKTHYCVIEDLNMLPLSLCM